MTTKNALKLFLFLLILFSAKAFSHPKLPNQSASSDCESKFGQVSKMMNTPKTASGGNSQQSKNTALRGNLTPRVSLKISNEK
ncbi:hypothetical protein [Flavobacterium sp.]|uniref:hypothetical protein n=1 Tax=Flavobacterium sp. TaxID=239 RepID=UPI002D1FAA05|nr:hypothetical protein [Flavobacterium sp.]